MEVQRVVILIAIIIVATTEARYTRPQSRIYGGHQAVEGQFPYHVLVKRTTSNRAFVVCGGAIISKTFVVTAAHCTKSNSPPSDYSIRAGTTKFNSGGTAVSVAEVKVHPKYQQYNNDIALLRLSRSLEFSHKIKPIQLASTKVPQGSQVTITGWGGVESGGISDHLKYNTEVALNHDTCVQRLNVLADSMRCLTKSAGNGLCGGDSGGPAAYNGVLIGVSSFVVNGCGSSLPDGYTDILATRDWIRSNTDVD